MIFTMKKEQIFWVSVYLLLDCASAPLSAVLETEDYADITDVELPPLKLLHSFCALKPDNGPCRAMITQFFFNIHTQQCEEFMYGGCEGNQNRFATLEACQEKCTDVYPKTRTQTKLEKEKPDYCFLDEDSGLCRGYLTRYFYNNETKKCEEFKYGGCLGNQNNFMSLEQCKSTCEDLAHDQLDEAVHNTIISDSTDNTLPISSGGSMTPLDLTNNVTPADSVNSESAAPPPTEAPSFLGVHIDTAHVCTRAQCIWTSMETQKGQRTRESGVARPGYSLSDRDTAVLLTLVHYIDLQSSEFPYFFSIREK
ncbi:tissue factor pathway inhibitor isoform X2 [Meles meles]|uniref:tissue factor pathway inhibitor isoform X2 n=1 Tax=Meles meles TaxID=9662 RepID=UPI001E69B615|nr:tissue factor pathway inhibitor isoform X2 [Meles meles]